MSQAKQSRIPHDPGAEGAVIGSIIIGPEEIPKVVEHIGKEDFVREEAAELFQIVRERWRRGEPVDGVLVRADFLGRPNEKALFGYMRGALDNTPVACNAVYYAKAVKKASIERRLLRLLDDVRERITDPIESIEDKVAAVMELVTACPKAAEKQDISLAELIDDYFTAGDKRPGIPTGFPQLDDLTGGFKPGQLILVGGPTTIGKSSVLLDIFNHVAMKKRAYPYMVSLEMLNDEITERLLRNIARVPRGFDRSDPRIVESAEVISKCPGSFAMKREAKIDALCASVLSKRQRDDIGIAFIDHVHLVNAPGHSRYEQITYASKALKSLAITAEIPVVVAAQLSRAPRDRKEHRPFMSDLRDSGSLEQDSDVILLLYSEDYYRKQDNPEAELDGCAELIVAKNRNGPTGTVELVWLPEFSTFAERTKL